LDTQKLLLGDNNTTISQEKIPVSIYWFSHYQFSFSYLYTLFLNCRKHSTDCKMQ